MYKRGKFDEYVGSLSLNHEEFDRYIVRVLWNEENAKKLLLEKLGINVSYIKVENFDYEVMAYFNCALHNKLKYFIRIQRQFTFAYSALYRISVYMQQMQFHVNVSIYGYVNYIKIDLYFLTIRLTSMLFQ